MRCKSSSTNWTPVSQSPIITSHDYISNINQYRTNQSINQLLKTFNLVSYLHPWYPKWMKVLDNLLKFTTNTAQHPTLSFWIHKYSRRVHRFEADKGGGHSWGQGNCHCKDNYGLTTSTPGFGMSCNNDTHQIPCKIQNNYWCSCFSFGYDPDHERNNSCLL